MRKTCAQILAGIGVVFVSVLCACQPVSTRSIRPQTTLTATAANTSKPQPSLTMPVTQATETNSPTITAPVPPTPIPDTWKTYTNQSLNVTLRYPESWHFENKTRASGPDGFFELSTRSYQASEFDRLVNLCVLNANNPGLHSKYGPLPWITDWQGWNGTAQTTTGYGCVVSPSGPDGAQAVLYARETRMEKRNQLLVLRADAMHFSGILSSLGFIEFETQSPSNGYYNSSFCKETPDAEPITTKQAGDLVISEYAIANETCDPWKHFDGFQARVMGISAAVKRDALRERAYETRLADANNALAPFGYQVMAQPSNKYTFDLFKGAEVVSRGFTNFRPVSVNSAGNDFILWLQDNFNSKGPVEVRPGGARSLNYWEEGFNSVWAGADLVAFDYSKNKLFPVGAPAQVDVSKNGRIVQTLSIPQMGPDGSPIRGLWSWRDHWIMDVAGVLFQDGEMQNPLLGYDEIFDWHLVNGNPFFLARQGKSFGIVYNGEFLAARYTDIIHGNLCCDSARYAVEDLSTGSVFYALKDGVWFLITVQSAQ